MDHTIGRIVDFHAHFLPQSIIAAADTARPWHGTEVERDADGMPVLVTRGRRKTMGSALYWREPEDRLGRMTAAGVDTQVLSVAPVLFRYEAEPDAARSAAREINDEIAALSQRWPDRFLGLATLPLQDVAASVQELERAVRDLGLVGASVGTHVAGENWDAARLYPVLEAAEQLGVLIFFHPTEQRVGGIVSGHHLGNMIGNPLETTVTVASLIFGGVLDRLPGVRLLFAHAGGFCYANVGRFDHGYRSRADVRTDAARLPSEYLTSLYFDALSHDGRSLRHLLDVAGVGQVVLGTDYPADMGMADPVAWLQGCDTITDVERGAICSGNAAALLGTAPAAV